MACEIIAVCNQKGGVGKTTTSVNLAASLAHRGRKVLLIDLDAQGNATTGSGIDKTNFEFGTYHLLTGEVETQRAILRSESGQYDVVGSNSDLTGIEMALLHKPAREMCLKSALSTVKDNYDYVIIDCPPTLSLLLLNGLAAADNILIPMVCEYYALEGVTDLIATIRKVRQTINPKLDILGVVFTMFTMQNKLSQDVSAQLKEHFGQRVFKTTIPRNVRLAEAPSFGLPALAYDDKAKGTIAYLELADEVLSFTKRKTDSAAYLKKVLFY